MRTSHFFAIVATVAMTLSYSDAWGRPGRGGGQRAGGGASSGARRAPAPAGNRPNVGAPKKSNRGGNPVGKSNAAPGNFGKNAGGKLNGNAKGHFDNGKFGGERPTDRQLKEFLGQQTEALKSRDFQRGEKATQNRDKFQAQASQIQSSAQAHADNLFTPQWYAQHPHAWQATHPHADAWAVATAASVAAWVGTAAHAGGSDTVVVETGNADAATESSDEQIDDGQAAATDQQDLTSTDEATEEVTDPTQWLSLGVFALAQDGQTEPTTLIQLSVNKQGQLNGSYYDLVSDNGTPVGGQLDVDTQRAAWTVGENSKNVFATGVDTLTGDSGPVTLHLPGDKTQDWNLIRLEQPEPKPTSPNSR